jgi:CHAD domain-containing protein
MSGGKRTSISSFPVFIGMPRIPGHRASGEGQFGRSATGWSADACGSPGRGEPAPEIVCRLAAQRILPLLDAYRGEIEGVKEGTDNEHLHRMRVASRRLRAALRTFRACLPKKKYRKVFSGTRAVTKSLGEARDADVQIAHLRKMRKRISAAGKMEGKTGSGDLLEAIQYLLAKLRQERAGYQRDVVRAVERYERQGQTEFTREVFNVFAIPRRHRRVPGEKSTLTLLAAENIAECLSDLLSHEPWLQHPDAILEHHAMRISAKHLRYTLETFAPLYRRRLKKYIARAARMQQLLGDVHDNDVWIETVSRIILKERSRPRAPEDPARPGPAAIAGLKVFLRMKERDRIKVFRRTVTYWKRISQAGLWEHLRQDVVSGLSREYSRELSIPDSEQKEKIEEFVQSCPGGAVHSRLVARLSLELFDQLQQLHNLTGKERNLLEFAALLHDTGFRRRVKKKEKESARVIHRAAGLPLSLQERGAIGLLVYSHRGRDSWETRPYFSLLQRQEQEVIRQLAGLLMVAESLDENHRGTVSSLACEVTPGGVICTVQAASDCSREIATVGERAVTFERAFGRTLRLEQAGKDTLPGETSQEIPAASGHSPGM